ncbi:hypothetical protein AAMO2058_001330900 [Amorphochlora amoebiformis]
MVNSPMDAEEGEAKEIMFGGGHEREEKDTSDERDDRKDGVEAAASPNPEQDMHHVDPLSLWFERFAGVHLILEIVLLVFLLFITTPGILFVIANVSCIAVVVCKCCPTCCDGRGPLRAYTISVSLSYIGWLIDITTLSFIADWCRHRQSECPPGWSVFVGFFILVEVVVFGLRSYGLFLVFKYFLDNGGGRLNYHRALRLV